MLRHGYNGQNMPTMSQQIKNMPDAVKDTAEKYTNDKGQGYKRYTTFFQLLLLTSI